MSSSDSLDDEQARTLGEATRLILDARATAAGMLADAGIDPGPGDPRNSDGFLGPCTRVLSPGPPLVRCGCNLFSPAGGSDFCVSHYDDHTAPDFGVGPAIRICGHSRESHLSI
ncbi:DUF6422 family protein [Pseudonocardia zijingensis]|jgi:hypothetical protein|uniref:Uncharacterized protein n=1 Tax=Pseudonocardia zijingensis TaxID=153376 RepID=A0ABN1PJG9_9PSEU